jgi:peptidoglycan/LPS O-acetylase OafA/YrhL
VIPRILAGYAALMVALGVAVIFGPASWGALLWAAIAMLTVAAIVGGTFLHRPERRSPWWLLAGAVLAMGIGDTIFGATVQTASQSAPVVAHVAYLLMIPLVTAGLSRAAQDTRPAEQAKASRSSSRDRSRSTAPVRVKSMNPAVTSGNVSR